MSEFEVHYLASMRHTKGIALELADDMFVKLIETERPATTNLLSRNYCINLYYHT